MTPVSPTTIGLTTTVPVEVIFAAGLTPCDLNNVFITSGRAAELVAAAERAGFPENACAWYKGIYATAREMGLRRLVAVTQGDCSNTQALVEMLEAEGVEVIPFAYPYRRDPVLLRLHLERFAAAFGVTLDAAAAWKEKLDRLRALAHQIDEKCWRDGTVRGEENHLWSISCSDFLGDPAKYEAGARAFLAEAAGRPVHRARLRLGLAGVPPICSGLFALLEQHGADIVFNEVPRQFAMPYATNSLLEQYVRYTYPYDVSGRLEDIATEVERRHLDGVIHYVQSFCFRHVQDVLLRRRLDAPILTLECDRPAPLDGRSRTRVEAFLETLAVQVPRDLEDDRGTDRRP